MPSKIRLYLGKVIGERVQLSELDKITERFFLPLDGCFLVSGDAGTGKTVLAKAIAEEGVLNGVPTLIIDPKGNLAQVCWPLEIGCYFGQSKKEGDRWRALLGAFGIEGVKDKYAELLEIRLLDHSFSPTRGDILDILRIKEATSIPVTIVVPYSDDEKENRRAIEDWLSKIVSALKDLSGTKTEKLLIIDEAHRFMKKGSRSYESLETILRENRNSKLRVVLCTQRFKDIRDLSEHVTYRFDFVKNRRCAVSYRPTSKHDFVQMHDFRTHLSPRGLLTVDRTDAMMRDDFRKTRDYWDVQRHPWDPIFGLSAELRLIELDAIDVGILNFLNCRPVKMDWDSSRTQLKKLNISKATIERILSNKELRNLAHYHAILDYEKLGYSILAFFICKSRESKSEDYRRGIQAVLNWANTLDLYEISSPEEVDVNLLAKFRFKDMDEYYERIKGILLKISKRGKSEKERYRTFVEELLDEIPKRVTDLKDLRLLLEKELPVKIPSEQLVSGCIKTKTFSEYKSCYLEPGTFRTLSQKDHRNLRRIVEIRYPEFKVDLDIKHILHEMQQLKLIRSDFNESELRKRVHRLVQKGIIKGTYLGIPWGMLGYKTKFIIGQLDFDHLETLAQKLTKHNKIQEVHTIVGTYDVIIKVRFKEKGEVDAIHKHVNQFIHREELIELDVEDELKTKFRMIRYF